MSDKDHVDIKYGMTKTWTTSRRHLCRRTSACERYGSTSRSGKWEEGKPTPLKVSKIESVPALNLFDEILEGSDGIMVMRGDLGVEILIRQVTNAQKEMVAACNAPGKPVNVTTQM
ncbi:hypothetical protein ACHAWF_001772, partial [Thalassiosira exigua]